MTRHDTPKTSPLIIETPLQAIAPDIEGNYPPEDIYVLFESLSLLAERYLKQTQQLVQCRQGEFITPVASAQGEQQEENNKFRELLKEFMNQTESGEQIIVLKGTTESLSLYTSPFALSLGLIEAITSINGINTDFTKPNSPQQKFFLHIVELINQYYNKRNRLIEPYTPCCRPMILFALTETPLHIGVYIIWPHNATREDSTGTIANEPIFFITGIRAYPFGRHSGSKELPPSLNLDTRIIWGKPAKTLLEILQDSPINPKLIFQRLRQTGDFNLAGVFINARNFLEQGENTLATDFVIAGKERIQEALSLQLYRRAYHLVVPQPQPFSFSQLDLGALFQELKEIYLPVILETVTTLQLRKGGNSSSSLIRVLLVSGKNLTDISENGNG